MDAIVTVGGIPLEAVYGQELEYLNSMVQPETYPAMEGFDGGVVESLYFYQQFNNLGEVVFANGGEVNEGRMRSILAANGAQADEGANGADLLGNLLLRIKLNYAAICLLDTS